VMNGVNILLSIIFVLWLDMGVQGVAYGTVIAEVLGAGLALYLCRNAFAHPDWRKWSQVFDRVKLIRMALLNIDILIRSALLMTIFSSFVFLGTRFDDVTLAANEVLVQFMYITAYAMDGFAFAAETLIARAKGRNDRARVRRSAILTSGWGLVTCVTTALLFAMFGPWLIDVMTKSAEVQAEARLYLPWMIAAPLVGCAAWMFDGIFIGATQGRDMRNMMIVSFVIYWIAVWVFLPLFGNHGLWMALLVSFIARGITLGLRYPALEVAAGKP
jgi:MATE family multidrug resistance protein